MAVTIEVITDPRTGQVEEHALALDSDGAECEITLECAPGASAVEIFLREDGAPVFLAEADASRDEPCRLRIRRAGGGNWHVHSRGAVRTLSPSARGASRLMPPSADGELDLIVLVDATAMRLAQSEQDGKPVYELRQLIDTSQSDAWTTCSQGITRWVESLAHEHESFRYSVLAFGDVDDDLEEVNRDLRPLWAVYPEREDDRRLRAGGAADVANALWGLRASPGGDFVDALAEALRECSRLKLRENARKLLLIFGDSPGHEVSDEAPEFADAQLRSSDVDEQAELLFSHGIEIVTIFNDYDRDIRNAEGAEFVLKQEESIAARYMDFARRQYRRLATLPEWFFLRSEFDAESAAKVVLERPGVLGRRGCLGIWRE